MAVALMARLTGRGVKEATFFVSGTHLRKLRGQGSGSSVSPKEAARVGVGLIGVDGDSSLESWSG